MFSFSSFVSLPARACVPLATLASAAVAVGCYGATALPGASAEHVGAQIVPASSGDQTICRGRKPQPLNSTWKLTIDGRERTFVVHVPRSYDPSISTPLVINFHGFTMSPKIEDWLTEMAAKSDAAGFLLAYPQGTGSPASFNAGTCCGDALHDSVDDIAFTRAMLDRLEADLCVDVRRVYATGMSNGGAMTHRVACEMSDQIAAVAPVAAVNIDPTCSPARAISVLDFHGTADPTVPYGGDPRRGWSSAPASIEAWAKRDGCSEKGVETLARGSVRCVTHGECHDGAEVTLCTIEGGGHTWPGGADVPRLAGNGATTHDVVADDLIWSFFQKHPMPPNVVEPAHPVR